MDNAAAQDIVVVDTVVEQVNAIHAEVVVGTVGTANILVVDVAALVNHGLE